MISRPLKRLSMLTNHLSAAFSTEDPVLFQEAKNGVRVVLNKPARLNAIDIPMLNLVHKKIDHFNDDKNIKVILLKGTGPKAFCAGGDIRSLYDAKKSGDPSKLDLLDEFFRVEFTVDYLVSQLRPVTVALWDGIVMGGGVGISIHSNIKVATENSMFAMPEAELGFFTDVGGSYFLPRLKSHIGYLLGLTGHRLKGKDLVQTGLADYLIKRERLPEVEEELLNNTKIGNVNDVREVLSKYAETVDKKYPGEENIEKIFNKETLKEIVEQLKSNGDDEFSKNVLKLLEKQSPMSLRVIFEQLKRGQNMTLTECFKMDFRLTQHFMANADFFEGVRCKLIDTKDKPKWQHKSIDEITQEEVNAYFNKLSPEKELKI